MLGVPDSAHMPKAVQLSPIGQIRRASKFGALSRWACLPNARGSLLHNTSYRTQSPQAAMEALHLRNTLPQASDDAKSRYHRAEVDGAVQTPWQWVTSLDRGAGRSAAPSHLLIHVWFWAAADTDDIEEKRRCLNAAL